MQSYFDEELTKLKYRIIKMMNLVGSQLERTCNIILQTTESDFESMKHYEQKIDKLDLKIDKLCLRIFALAQPVAKDLRFIMAALKINSELERIGDMAFEISERSESLSQLSGIAKELKIDEIIRFVTVIQNQTLESFINNNSYLANENIKLCSFIDQACKEISAQVVAGMLNKSEVIVVATDIILIISNLELVLGHYSDIAESIIFIVEGKTLKHADLQSTEKKLEEIRQ